MVPGDVLQAAIVSGALTGPRLPIDCLAVSKANKRERQRLNREQRRIYEGRLAKRRRMWKTARTFAIIAAPIIVIGAVLSLTTSSGDNGKPGSGSPCPTVKTAPVKSGGIAAPTQTLDPSQAYSGTIDTTCGTIEVAIDAQQYPVSANNFVYLAQQGFYDDLAFNRAAKGFVIQTGSPDQTIAGGPGYTVQAEVPSTSPAYPVGTVAWAKTSSEAAGTAGSQFFIVTGDASALPVDYAAIGTVSTGLDVAKKINKLAPTSGDGALRTPVVMKKVTITTRGVVPPSSTP